MFYATDAYESNIPLSLCLKKQRYREVIKAKYYSVINILRYIIYLSSNISAHFSAYMKY